MERLPYIDEHSIRIGATPEQVWPALVRTLGAHLGGIAPAALARALAPVPGTRRGAWREDARLGDTLVGFAVTDVRPAERLELSGGHRFSRYALVFELDQDGPDGCTVRAQTWAEFPGIAGRAYRAMVIGSHGHRMVVRRLLAGIARRA